MEATLSKWGNSKGIRVPAEVCDELGLQVGAKAEMSVDPEKAAIILTFRKPARKYSRTRKMTMEEFAGDWSGGRVGDEWGGAPTGREVI